MPRRRPRRPVKINVAVEEYERHPPAPKQGKIVQRRRRGRKPGEAVEVADYYPR